MTQPAYQYRAVVQSVYDADTITVDMDLGLWTWRKNEKLRLYGIDAPEVRGQERESGVISRDWLRDQLPEGQEIVVSTIKDKTGKYGRLLAVVWLDGVNLNEKLVELGLADTADY